MDSSLLYKTILDDPNLVSCLPEPGVSPVALFVSDNIKNEADAITHYNEMLLIPELQPEDAEIIKEIISDEKNHIERLKTMLTKYDSNIPTNAE